MYLHAGKDTVIRCDDIIGVFDIDNTSVSKITREYLKESKGGENAKKEVITVADDLPKSFIVASERKKRPHGGVTPASKGLTDENSDKDIIKIYISQISTATLLKRLETGGKNGSALRGELYAEKDEWE